MPRTYSKTRKRSKGSKENYRRLALKRRQSEEVNNDSRCESETVCEPCSSTSIDTSNDPSNIYKTPPPKKRCTIPRSNSTSGPGLRVSYIHETSASESSTRAFDDIVDHAQEELAPLDTKYGPSGMKTVAGRRIVNVDHMAKQFVSMGKHTNTCTCGKFELVDDAKNGFHSTLTYKCRMCGLEIRVTTEEDQESLNDAAVWGSMAIGIGREQLEELMAVLDVPVMSATKFSGHERKIGKKWEEHLHQKMRENGEEELRLAKLNGDYLDGVLYITVIVDGGWSKRSYKHGYNALSGVACIIGARTNKLLYLAVRNKYCATCVRRKWKASDGPPAADHVCFKNYSGTSTAMEQDVIVEGFCSSLDDHGVMYRYMTGDGDSSVYARVRENVPYGRYVEKIECANHVIRCYKENMYSLCNNKVYNLESRKLLKGRVDRLCKGARAAIRYCEGDVAKLKADIMNGPYHVLGKHDQCSDFCKRKGKQEPNIVRQIESSNLWIEVKKLVVNLTAKADRLKDNVTTNQAERLMGCVAKFVGGKRVNYSTAGSYQHRSMGAGLAHTSGPSWHSSPWKRLSNKSPGRVFGSVLNKRKNRLSTRRLRFQKEDNHRCRRRPATAAPEEADFDYGPNAAVPDLEVDEMKRRQDVLLENLQASVDTLDKMIELERGTVGQRNNERWRQTRINLLTASNFGKIINRRPYTPCHNQVKEMLYGKAIYSRAIQYGIDNEPVAIKQYESQYGVTVLESGIFVRPECPYLGASPDGLVGEDGLVEVKCLFAIGDQSPSAAAADKKKNMCVQLIDNELKLKIRHNYHYQIQGQLHIADRQYCDLVLYSEGGFDVIRINRDVAMWEKDMFPKLDQFYRECLLPEIVDGRIPRGMPIREPLFITDAIRVRSRALAEKNARIPKRKKDLPAANPPIMNSDIDDDL